MEFNKSQPIWLQLTEEFERRIVSGQWAAGERIPSVRGLAAELGVNPNTVQKSLVELDRRGLTEPERAVGRRVTTSASTVDRAREELSRHLAAEYVTGIKGLGLGINDAAALVEASWDSANLSDQRKEMKWHL